MCSKKKVGGFILSGVELMSNLFKKYLGKLEVEVDNEKLQLDMQIQDMEALLEIATKSQTSETIKELTKICKQIIKRSYPDASDEELDAFLAKKLPDFLAALTIALGWTTKEDLKRQMEKKGLQVGEKQA